ncbi:class II aldolase/adducin family protein [Paenibacillus alginolyticus]|uniref:class II aldolase/adducin family protein n=1 Tax=Paenibacillus alginolyticus TaxID=59839 RepID=UPI000415CBAC|nr:class II aldolase/adducin family protein [Paenibacillus alginolyticus]MCY9666774.1 class II aldolase/adducin family protein [Paenibacillus alginolyticus]
MNEHVQEWRSKVAQSCRILAMEGLVEGILGHVSVRMNDQEMLIRCRGEQETGVRYTMSDAIRLVDFDGKGNDLIGRYEVPKELPIHGEIYKSRPEVGCVIHAHPPSALICGISELAFKPIFGAFNIPAMRMALRGIPVYPRSVLVTRPDLAAPMIEIMGDEHICLMKGHGITVTGKTLEEATIRALNFNILAEVTLETAKLGKGASSIPPEDIEELPDLGSTFNDIWAWRHYIKKLEKDDRLLAISDY